MRKILLITPILLFLLLVNVENIFACSCAADTAPLEVQVKFALQNSTAVFSGKVISIKPNPPNEDDGIVKFKIEKAWKGRFHKNLIINIPNDSGMCGYPFEVGKKYLIYAYGKEEDLGISICTRTANLANNKDLKILDKLKKKKT